MDIGTLYHDNSTRAKFDFQSNSIGVNFDSLNLHLRYYESERAIRIECALIASVTNIGLRCIGH